MTAVKTVLTPYDPKKEYRLSDGTLLTDELLDEWAKKYEEGTWEGVAEVAPGRPRLSNEELKTVAFKLPNSLADAMDKKAKAEGLTRSQFLRQLVVAALV